MRHQVQEQLEEAYAARGTAAKEQVSSLQAELDRDKKQVSSLQAELDRDKEQARVLQAELDQVQNNQCIH